MGLFSGSQPLADRMRPQTLEEFVGQEELIGRGTLIRRAIEEDSVGSMIFWGPPGSGKHNTCKSNCKYYQSAFCLIFCCIARGERCT